MKKLVYGSVALVFVVLLLPVVLVGAIMGSSAAATPVACTITGAVKGLTASQAKIAEDIVAEAGLTQDATQAAAIGLDAAYTVSTLTNLPLTATEVGPFAFSPSGQWGPSDSLSSSAEDAVLFMIALEQVPGWQTNPASQVAQETLALGGTGSTVKPARFEKVLPRVTAIATKVLALATASDCGAAASNTLAGVGSGTLPAGYRIPASATPQETEAIAAALSQVGGAYVWGGATPEEGFDCSGLTMWAWAQAEPPVQLDHYTVSQWQETQALTPLDPFSPTPPPGTAPGDLVLAPGSDGTLSPANPQHVGMFIGDVDGVPYVVDAADEQLGIIVQTYSSFAAGGVIAVGHIPTAAA